MHASKNYLTVLCVCSTIALALFAWHQHLELRGIRRNGLSDPEHVKVLPATLDIKTLAVERTDGDLRGHHSAPPFAVLAQNPVFTHLWTAYQKFTLDTHYGVLFRQLHLSPAELEAFKDLLVQKQLTLTETLSAAQAQGRAGPGDFVAIHRLEQQVQNATNAGIRRALGPDKFTKYESYEETFPERTIINQLAQHLLYTDSPLQDYQIEQLVQIMADNLLPSGPNSPLGPNIRVSDQFIAHAKAVINPSQINALRALQQHQLERQELSQMVPTGQGL